jgi:CSLREA domain-containing protein
MKIQHFVFACFISLLLVAGFSLVLQVSAAPVTAIVVDTLADEPVNSDSKCSLREAITAANDNSATGACPAGQSGSPDTITFSVAGTITLYYPIAVIAGGPLVIDGGEVITVSGDNKLRVFQVENEAQLTLVNITVADGYEASYGGGIANWGGSVTIANSTFRNNSSDLGGGIYNEGLLTITDTYLAHNHASGYGGVIYNKHNGTLTLQGGHIRDNDAIDGGGIYNSGSLYIGNNCDVRLNSATGDGGGIYNNEIGEMTIVDAWLYGNWAIHHGGGIYNLGVGVITDSDFSENDAGHGGSIYNGDIYDHIGTLDITTSTFSSNRADYGGGISNWRGTVTITNSTFSGNDASFGGGIYNKDTLTITDSSFSGNRADEYGGGIHNSGELDITDSTFSENEAVYGGGIYNDYSGTLEIANSTLAENSAGWGGGIDNRGTFTVTHSTFTSNGASFGGGIYNHENSTLTIANNTFSNNNATDYGGGISNWRGTVTITNSTFYGNSAEYGGGVENSDGTLTIVNSILADNPSGDNCYGTITDDGHNIEDTNKCGFGPAWSDQDPLLAPLEDNGGPTLTHALLEGSPAIDNADPLHCPTTDQRGFPRPYDGDGDGDADCDIGAFELQPRRLFLPTIIKD